jgi:Ca2+-binding RTX toxin-like protein
MTKTLYSSSGNPVSLFSYAAGTGTLAGGTFVLWSHVATPYSIADADWDPSSETGLSTVPGAQVLTTDASDPGSTAIEVLPNGEFGGIINSNDLNLGGQVPNGPMALIPSWTPSSAITPFSDPSVGAVDANVSLQVPYSEEPGFGSSVSSNQIVLYVGLEDLTTGQSLAYGLTIFDSRGTAAPYFGIDDGAGGTGAAVITSPAGSISNLDYVVPGTSSFQGGPWTGMRNFTLEITPQTLAAAIAEVNQKLSSGQTPFSTNIANYSIQDVSLDAEIEYFGQPNSFSYSVGSFSVTESATTSSVDATQATEPTQSFDLQTQVNTIANGTLPETVSAAAGTDYLVNAGSGALDFNDEGSVSTIYGGAGAETVSGDTGRVVASGGLGASLLIGGTSGGNILAASLGNATLIAAGSNAPDVLYGGEAGSEGTLVGGNSGSVIVAGAGNDLMFASGGAATMFGATAGGTATLVGGSRGSTMVADTGKSVIFAGSGNDTIFGSQQGGSAEIIANSGNDLISLGAGQDSVFAGGGADTIFTGSGSQLISTGQGNTIVVQSAPSSQQDTVMLGDGSSTVFGGENATLFTFANLLYDDPQTDYLIGFNIQTDRIAIGSLSAAAVLATSKQTDLGTSIQVGSATIVFMGPIDLSQASFV